MLNRKFEKPDSGFIDRIIAKSYEIVQKKPLPLVLKNIFAELRLPSPQYALSLLFAVGLAISMAMPAEASYDFLKDIYFNGVLINE